MSSAVSQQDSQLLYLTLGDLRIFPSFEHIVSFSTELRSGTDDALTASYVLEPDRNEDLAVYMALDQDNPRSVVWITRHSNRHERDISGGVINMFDIPESSFPRSLSIAFGQDFTEESIVQGMATMNEDMKESTRWDSLSPEMKDLWDLVHSNKAAVVRYIHDLAQGTVTSTG